MALNELLNFNKVVPLIPNSGVQFTDFGFSIEKTTPVPKDFAFYDPTTTLNNDTVPICVRRGDAEAKGVDSYSFDLRAIEQMFDRVWVPIPFFKPDNKGFYPGPTNWTRVYLARLDEPDQDGNRYRLVLAVDTTLLPHRDGEAYLAPTAHDVTNGVNYALPAHDDPIAWFYKLGWVKDWCLHTFRQMLERQDRSKRQHRVRKLEDEDVHARMEGSNEHVARYMAFIDLLHSLDKLPALQLTDRISEPMAPPLDVDLVLDLGNSRSCGMLIESDLDRRSADVSTAVKLQLRDLSQPEQVYSDPFPSRFEFARVEFGPEHLSSRGGRPDAFNWPTAVRVGVEAARLAARRSGTEGSSGLSSPKRYLWDDDTRTDPWQFSTAAHEPGSSNFALGVAFTTHVNDRGEPLHMVDPNALKADPDRAYEAMAALYTRRNLTAFALGEIFVQAISQVNSPMYRLRRSANANLPRRLRRIILTMPTAMPLAERQILKQQAEAACDLAFLSLGLARKVKDDDGPVRIEYPRQANPPTPHGGPEVILQWDEATATQAIYLYTQIALNHSGDARSFFRGMRLPERQSEPAAGDHFRLATIDLGGGTTDLVITSIAADGAGAHVSLTPRQEFREGFNLAGDDVLLRVVRDHVVEPLRAALRTAGLGERADFVLNQMLGGDRGEMKPIELVRRQQFAAQIAAPIALEMLQAYEAYDPLVPTAPATRGFNEFFRNDNRPTPELLAYFDTEIAKHGTADFHLESLQFTIDLQEIDLSVRAVLLDMLQALGELIYRYRCDMVILSGRTSRLPAVRAILEESGSLPSHRVLPLHLFRVGSWYPFRDYHGTVGDPKTTAAVGAMICLLGNGQLHNFNFRSNELRPRSTARYFGKLDQANRLWAADEFYNDLDLDRDEYEIPDQAFEFRGPMALGFRQLPVDWWPASKLYVIEYATNEDGKRLGDHTPLKVKLKREGKSTVDKLTQERYYDNPGLAIDSVEDKDGNNVPKNRLRLRLQTLGQEKGYWLDTGILIGS